MRRFLVLAVALVSLAGCSGSAEPSAPSPTPSHTASPPSSPTPSPSPTPPVMPEAAKAHTKAGAKAFVRYFWEVVDYAGQMLDSRPLADLTADGCVGCLGAIKFVEDMRSGKARFFGASTSVGRFELNTVELGDNERTEVLFDVTTPNQVADFPGETRDEHYPATTARTRFYLKAVPDGWRVVLWESA